MTSLSILDGPRGRRVCLELAALHPDVCATLFHARLPYQGSPSTVFLIGDGATQDPQEHPSPEELAEIILACGVPHFGDAELHRAVSDSVGAARYWQEIDGDDQLATLPIVRAALEPIAGAVETSSSAAAWSRTRTPQQWAVDRAPLDRAAVSPRDAASVLSDWTASVRREETTSRARNLKRPTRWTGTWWSVPPVDTSFSAQDHALDFIEDSLGEPVATLTLACSDARTYEIETAEDWAELCRRFPTEVTESRRHDWYRVTGREGRWLIPDWERVANDWDLVHLTVRGYLTAATRVIRIDDEYASVIAGWAPDSTLWLVDLARSFGAPRREWVKDADHDAWRLARFDDHVESR